MWTLLLSIILYIEEVLVSLLLSFCWLSFFLSPSLSVGSLSAFLSLFLPAPFFSLPVLSASLSAYSLAKRLVSALAVASASLASASGRSSLGFIYNEGL